MRRAPLLPERPRRGLWRRRGARFALSGLLVAVLPGCATKGDIREMTTAVEQLQRQASRTDSVLVALGFEIRALQDTLEIESGREVDVRGGLARDIRDIRDQLSRLGQLTGQIQRQIAQLDARLQRSAQDMTLPPTVAPDSAAEGLIDPTASGGPPQDVEEIFDIALREFSRGALFTARAGFERFLQLDPNHSLAAQVHFNLGDIAEQQNRLDDALASWLTITERFPRHDRVPAALYRAGRLEYTRGNNEEAKVHLERVVNSYPDSDTAALAEEILREIGIERDREVARLSST